MLTSSLACSNLCSPWSVQKLKKYHDNITFKKEGSTGIASETLRHRLTPPPSLPGHYTLPRTFLFRDLSFVPMGLKPEQNRSDLPKGLFGELFSESENNNVRSQWIPLDRVEWKDIEEELRKDKLKLDDLGRVLVRVFGFDKSLSSKPLSDVLARIYEINPIWWKRESRSFYRAGRVIPY